MMRLAIARLMAMFHRSRSERDLNDDVRFHLETLAEEYVQKGMNPREARYAARRAFGGIDQMKEIHRDHRALPFIDTTIQDLRYGLRMLAKTRVFAFVAILTLSLGIAVNVTVFSVINGLLLRPPEHVESPQQLVALFQTENKKGDKYLPVWSYPDYAYYRDYSQVFSGLAAYSPIFLTIETAGESQQVTGDIVSGNYFSVLGTRAFLGRLFLTASEDTTDSARAAVVSYELWHDRLGGDPGLIGRTIRINRQGFTVIGVAPQHMTDLGLQLAPAVWVPLEAQPVLGWPPGEDHVLQNRGTGWLTVLGRLKPGVTPQQALANLKPLARNRQRTDPVSGQARDIAIESATKMPVFVRGPVLGFVGLIQALGGLLLFIPCANMASLLLARASARRGEIIIRSAIGASRWRITRQLLTESLIIALCAGAVGLFLAYWWTEALTHLQLPFGIPVHLELHPDVRVIGFTLLVAFTTVLLFGMGPALQLSRVSLASGAGRQNSVASRRRSWKARLLVVAQISISLLLLIGAGLCVRSLRNAELIDPGFETRNILVFSISSRTTGHTGGQAAGFYRDLLERVKRIQGVQSVSLSALVPLGYGTLQETVAIKDGSGGTPQRHAVSENLVTPDYFQTLGIPVVRGNTFRNESEARNILVNEAFIRRFLPAQDAIGRQLTLGEGQDARLVQIVGITRDTKYRTLGEAPEPLIYGLLTPGQEGPTGAAVLIRTFRAPEALISTILSQVHALDSSLPPPRIETMSEHIGSALWLAHSMATLFSVLGMIATFLAMIGLYGSVAYSVSSRINEIGVRMALGAQRADILKMIEGEGLFLTSIGIGIGLAAAVALTRFMGNLLYGLSPTDPPTLIGVSLLFILVALAACYIPSRNATRVDPMMALREP